MGMRLAKALLRRCTSLVDQGTRGVRWAPLVNQSFMRASEAGLLWPSRYRLSFPASHETKK